MSTGAMSRSGGSGYLQRSNSSGLVDVLDVLLDKGLVVDVFLRVSLVGIELLTVDARIVIASVDTYLRFAEAVNRLDLQDQGGQGLPEIMENITEGGAENKTKGVLQGAKESLFGSDDDEKQSSGSGRSSSRSGQRTRASSRQKATTRGRSQS